MANNLSKKAIDEKYEDLLFTKVMALYAEEESKKILEEINTEEQATPEAVKKIYSKIERKKIFADFWKYSRKILQFAAMVVFVAVISVSSVVVASASARTAMAETLYKIIYETHEKYTEIKPEENLTYDKNKDEYVGTYFPAYIPNGFKVTEKYEVPGIAICSYAKGDENIIFLQQSPDLYHIDTENAEVIQNITINESEALLVIKEGLTTICMNREKIMISVLSNTDTYTALKFAEGITQIK